MARGKNAVEPEVKRGRSPKKTAETAVPKGVYRLKKILEKGVTLK